jgi:hypothetical protein
MRFDQVIVGAAFFAAIIASSGAGAFETNQIGGTNPDGSAHFQDPEEQKLPAPLGSTQTTQQGSGFSEGMQSPATGWSFTQSPSSIEPKSGFNEPLLRENP